jgi:hypothetical protein
MRFCANRRVLGEYHSAGLLFRRFVGIIGMWHESINCDKRQSASGVPARVSPMEKLRPGVWESRVVGWEHTGESRK